MQRTEVLDLVRTIRYKPGWRIAVRCAQSGHEFEMAVATFTIFGNVPNAGNPSEMIDVVSGHVLAIRELVEMDEQTLVDILFGWILMAERHEAEEFFSVGGKQPFDPHKGEARS